MIITIEGIRSGADDEVDGNLLNGNLFLFILSKLMSNFLGRDRVNRKNIHYLYVVMCYVEIESSFFKKSDCEHMCFSP
jgi:hypothetical protein